MAVERSSHYERMSFEAYLTLVEQDPEHADAIHYPSLVAEVLSPATEARDRGQKSLQYRACPSIQEYLLLSSEFPLVEVFRRENRASGRSIH